jgi:hypothetical protein
MYFAIVYPSLLDPSFPFFGPRNEVRYPDGRYALPDSDAREEVRTFSTMTRGLLALSDWLADQPVQLVVMEATADYWKPVFYMLEQRFESWLVNARDIKNVPGRKTSPTRGGSPRSPNTDWSGPRSCRRRRSAGCEI